MSQQVRKSVSLSPIVVTTIEAACKDSGLPFSTQVDQMIREWVKAQRLVVLGRAINANLITPHEAAEQIQLMS